MLIIALVLAVIGLAALVAAVVTSNELIAWVCIGASVLGTILLIVDALRERSRGAADRSGDEAAVADAGEGAVQDYPDDPVEAEAEEAEPEEAESTAESEPADEVDEADEAVEDDELDGEPAADEAAEEHKS
ncbi:hypothetical protein [Mycobacterium sp. 141]|uniref:hypothetical protein n=1 Tax=Mycobacterium sp. 141 TaxID=1120797 RepID=UPI0003735648|nr:hypothetical protein [Mycobacterium sp. 141]